jgi:predicted dehydrogenase
MSLWAFERGLAHRIYVSSAMPQVLLGSSSAAIVVNAVRDHEMAVEWAVSEGIPVLVEKPLTLSYTASKRLADLAFNKNSYLATAHVFLFASYIENFSRVIGDSNSVKSILVRWTDLESENRHGEAKRYDPGLPVYSDWLPHIISIVGTLTESETAVCEQMEFLKGGAHLRILVQLGNVSCAIELQRNSCCRQRIVEVTSAEKKTTLDFSMEPGTIATDIATECGDLDWDLKAKPVARMLAAFLQGAAGGACDSRLDAKIGLRANHLIDQVSLFYNAALTPWLSERLSMIDADDPDLRYALNEIIHAEYPRSVIPSEERVEFLIREIKGLKAGSHNFSLIDRPVDLIRSLGLPGGHTFHK